MTFEKQVQVELMNWLKPHMNDMLSLPYFTQVELLELKDLSGDYATFIAKYFYEKSSDIQSYFERDAEKMRSDLPNHFRERIQFQRFLIEENKL